MLTYEDQDEYRVAVKAELARRRMTGSQLAREIKRSRTAVQLAITRGMYDGTQRLIDDHLGLGFFSAKEGVGK